jgi:hypothetical protein
MREFQKPSLIVANVPTEIRIMYKPVKSMDANRCTLVSNKENLMLIYIVGLFVLLPLGAQGTRELFVSLQFLNLRHSVGLLGRVISTSQGRYLSQTQNKHKQTSMPLVGFEPTIPAFEGAKTVRALDRATSDRHSFIHLPLNLTFKN